MATLFNILILSSALLLLTTPRPITADDDNILLSGQTLGYNERLTYGNAEFVMQNDCNLVLYNDHRGWQSNTHGRGKNCTLSFTENGRLIIRDGAKTIWTSPNSNSKKGDYVAVLRPDQDVAIYGGKVWEVPRLTSILNEVGRWPRLTNLPLVKNVFFSGQVLPGGSKLWTGDYSFVMRGDCDLALEKGGEGTIWRSNTSGGGLDCSLRLDHFGQLSVVDYLQNTVWTSSASHPDEREYVLVLQYDGKAVVYGPKVWTAPSKISMVTDG